MENPKHIMKSVKAVFDTPHNDAYSLHGVLDADARWYAFDTRLAAAKAGQATKFVMALWADGIRQDSKTANYWYWIPYEHKGKREKNRVGLCNALRVAVRHGLPMVGVLKDTEEPKNMASRHSFSITDVELHADPAGIWIKLLPADPTDIGCSVHQQDIPVEFKEPRDLNGMEADFAAAVRKAASSHQQARLARMAAAPKHPQKVPVTATVFKRNPDVVAEALFLARGVCGYCKKPAPFARTSTGEPYLEVHHKIPLAKGGEDTIDNAIAACPNCHRERHHGLDI